MEKWFMFIKTDNKRKEMWATAKKYIQMWFGKDDDEKKHFLCIVKENEKFVVYIDNQKVKTL